MRKFAHGRRAQRTKVDLPCQITRRGGDRERTEYRMTELSSRGAWLVTDDPLPLGERGTMRFDIPGEGGTPVAVMAEVMRTTEPEDHAGEPGMGIEFLSLTPELMQTLQKALAPLPLVVGAAGRGRYGDADDR